MQNLKRIFPDQLALESLPHTLRICEGTGQMAEHRISHINLDDETILWRSADVEQERRVAMFDLIEENTFKPMRSAEAGHDGPYRLDLSVPEGRLSLVISDEAEE